MVWEAYQLVKANKGSAGIDKQTIGDFECNLKDNLYLLWNRLSSGSYFPPPVKSVPIPKKAGGDRILGVPTVADRIAQTVVKMVLEPILEPIFDNDSYGYRPRKSAHDAIAITRKRCWQYDWLVEFDIVGLFDNIDHELLIKALKHHCKCKWILLYVERWLSAPMGNSDGMLTPRRKGTPQGGVISVVLSNLFLHYTLDAWVRRTLNFIPFCRYADDAVLHCRSEAQAKFVLGAINQRLQECKLEIHEKKSKIVYCKDRNRPKEYGNIAFDFLGFTFRPRRCVDKQGRIHPNFLPAVSRSSIKSMNQRIRSWRIQLRNEKSLHDLSNMFNPIMVGWHQYYGKFYSSTMQRVWRQFNTALVQWARRKYKSLKDHKTRTRKYLKHLAMQNPNLFIGWKLGYIP